MTPVRLARNLPPRQALAQLAGAGATGVLHVRGRPGGVVHLTDGRVNHVECVTAPGVRTLLTVSGRLDPNTWDRTAAAGPGRVGELLVEHGHLTRGELELCVLGAIYDAAFFMLSGRVTEVRYAPQGRHWLGVVQLVDVEPLGQETDRRGNLLDAVHRDSTVDELPVALVRRPPGGPVVLSPLQWQLVVHADGRRTPTELAHLLGKPAYAVVLEVRRLAAARLLDQRAETAAGAAPPPVPTPAPTPAPGPSTSTAPGPSPAREPAQPSTDQLAPLPRRRAGRRDGRGRSAASEPGRGPPAEPARSTVDESTLVRIRTALEALP